MLFARQPRTFPRRVRKGFAFAGFYSSGTMRLKLLLLACSVVILCFLLCSERPYALTSDAGYQAWSALQYSSGNVSAINTLRLVSPNDLSKNVECPLVAWSPTGAWIFYWAFRLGVAPGVAGRWLALLAALIGAAGWAWIAWRIGLRGWWASAAVTMAALYCFRSGLNEHIGTEDYLVYAVAPWLLEAAFRLAPPLRGPLPPPFLARAMLLCAVLGAVYWLKYAGVFFGMAVFAGLGLEFLRAPSRRRPVAWLPLFALCGAAFLAPILLQKVSSGKTSGSDLVKTGLARHRNKPLLLFGQYVAETAYNASTVLFTVDSGIDRITGDHP